MTLQIIINGMDPEEAKITDLDVSTQQVIFNLKEKSIVKISVLNKFSLISSTATAKYSKKNKRMSVTIGTK